MSKEESNVTIEGLQRDGWKFRVKIVRGRLYLSARKGDIEKGLGFIKQEMLGTKVQATSEEPEQMVKDQLKQHKKNINTPSESTTSYFVTLNPLPTRRRAPPQKVFEVTFNRNEMEEVLFDIKYERSKIKARDCDYSFNGYCQFWGYIKDSQPMASIYERFGTIEYKMPILSSHAQMSKEPRDMFRVNELLCLDCDKYTPRVKPNR